MKSILAQLLMSCRQAARAQSERLEHPLPRAQSLGLWLHLLICRWCRRYGHQIKFLSQAAREHPDHHTHAHPAKLSPEARDRIKQRLTRPE